MAVLFQMMVLGRPVYTRDLGGSSLELGSFGTTRGLSRDLCLRTASRLDGTSTGNVGGDQIVTIVGRSGGNGVVNSDPKL